MSKCNMYIHKRCFTVNGTLVNIIGNDITLISNSNYTLLIKIQMRIKAWFFTIVSQNLDVSSLGGQDFRKKLKLILIWKTKMILEIIIYNVFYLKSNQRLLSRKIRYTTVWTKNPNKNVVALNSFRLFLNKGMNF